MGLLQLAQQTIILLVVLLFLYGKVVVGLYCVVVGVGDSNPVPRADWHGRFARTDVGSAVLIYE